MSQRERIASAHKPRTDPSRGARDSLCKNPVTQPNWETWQAAEAAALKPAAQFMDDRAAEIEACDNLTAHTMARVYRDEASKIRKLAAPVERGGVAMTLIEVVARQKDYPGHCVRSGRSKFSCGNGNDLRPSHLKRGNRVSMRVVIEMVRKCLMRDYESLHHAVNRKGETDIAIYGTRIIASAHFVNHFHLPEDAWSIVA